MKSHNNKFYEWIQYKLILYLDNNFGIKKKEGKGNGGRKRKKKDIKEK